MSDSPKSGCTVVLIVLGITLALGYGGACSRPGRSTETLQNQGYTNVKITGYRFFGCGDESFHDGFEATSPSGVKVTGVVCSGWFKGSTIRFD